MQQTMLDIEAVDIKATRRAVYAQLAVYRRYVQQLSDGWAPVKRAPVKGYEDAQDPDLIRKPGFNSSGIGGGLTPEEYRLAKIEWIDRKVDRLPPYGREIVRRRLMTPIKGYQSIHELPSDMAVLDTMQRDGWYGEQRYYDERKTEAVQMLAEALHLVVYKH